MLELQTIICNVLDQFSNFKCYVFWFIDYAVFNYYAVFSAIFLLPVFREISLIWWRVTDCLIDDFEWFFNRNMSGVNIKLYESKVNIICAPAVNSFIFEEMNFF